MKLNRRKLKLLIEQSLKENLTLEMEHPLMLEVKSSLEAVGLPVAISSGVQDPRNEVLIHVEYETVYIEASFKHAPQVGLALIPFTLKGYEIAGIPQPGFGVILFTVKNNV